MKRLLVVEDDPKLGKLLLNDLRFEGFQVDLLANGTAALEQAQSQPYDLLILDVMLPGLSGLEICRTLRTEGVRTPILMLTAKGQDADKIVGFQAGADDYLAKPFNILELIARIKAILWRTGADAPVTFKSGSLRVDFNRQEAWRGKTRLALTTKEFQILRYLIQHRGEVIGREQFLRDLWQFEELPTTRTVDNQVASLRRKLGWTETSKGPKIITVHNAGYRFVD